MNSNNAEQTPGTPPSLEHKMDALLSDFFQQEVPASLGQGRLNWDGVDADPVRSQRDVVVARPSKSWQKRLAAAISIAAVAACSMLMMNPTATDSVADGSSTEATVETGEPTMMVSPAAGQRDADATVVGDDGLTFGETDDIEFSPSRSDN